MWDERYADEFASYGTEPNDFLRKVAARIPDGPVLCLAEGEGRNAVFLAERGHAVTAVDQSEVGLRNAHRLAAQRGVELTTVALDLADYDPGESQWAGIVSIWCHLPVAIRRPLHQRCVRALRPGGTLILEAYTPQQLQSPGTGGPPSTDLLMESEDLRREFSGLVFERCSESERDVHEGKFHRGWSCVVQVLATKPTLD